LRVIIIVILFIVFEFFSVSVLLFRAISFIEIANYTITYLLSMCTVLFAILLCFGQMNDEDYYYDFYSLALVIMQY